MFTPTPMVLKPQLFSRAAFMVSQASHQPSLPKARIILALAKLNIRLSLPAPGPLRLANSGILSAVVHASLYAGSSRPGSHENRLSLRSVKP